MTFLKEFMLRRQANQKSMIFVTIGIKFQPDVCNRCHDLLIVSMNLSNIAIFTIKSADYCCTISGIIESEAVNLMQNIDMIEKSGHYKTLKYIITYKNR